MTKQKNEEFSLEKVLRKAFKGLLDGVAGFFLKIGLTPNAVTLLGLAGSIGAAVLIALGIPLWGGVVLLLMAPLDAVDGAMARLSGRSSKFGAFLDSVIDRYSELFIYAAILYMFFEQGNFLGVMVCFAAASGAVLVSYTRARAEALGFDAKVGVMTRVERSIVMIVGLLFGIIVISLVIIAVLAHLTAMMRMVTVWKQAKSRDPEPN
ncbi:MAG TPA: CDP-alcohol phosphatidyltransferase family protein [Anaerolineaceae bacterium]|nr:CDP-alcohol phosphatidyltransferase family protein [Anaerolineaceae bacterium]HQC64366.1 CDP-alcohol phosphatidyltransferase family protein [Anaerolineaceae bacterium]